MEYIILHDDCTSDLAKEVRDMIAQGWHPLGGVAVTTWEVDDSAVFVVAQAMVRDTETRNEGPLNER